LPTSPKVASNSALTALPETAAIIAEERVLAHAELLQTVEALATALTAHGLRRGDRVGLFLADTPEHLLLHFAIALAGGVILPMDNQWTMREASAVINSFTPSLVLADQPIDDKGDTTFLSVAQLLETSIVETSNRELPQSDEPVLISLSSGTTGRPKGAVVSHAQLAARFAMHQVDLGFNGDDRFLCVSPLYFGAGRAFCMSILLAGGTVILHPPPFEVRSMVDVARTQRATLTFAVPTVLRQLLAFNALDRPLFDSMRLLITSGAP
jgi:long-chain acyl-CoA synthetase